MKDILGAKLQNNDLPHQHIHSLVCYLLSLRLAGKGLMVMYTFCCEYILYMLIVCVFLMVPIYWCP
jgi:hypothetical protein